MSGHDTSAEPDLSGMVLGRYRLVQRLGMGGMGSVYLAQHEMLDRKAAVKVLNQSLANQSASRKRFLREAKAASQVHHPGVVEIHDVAFSGNHVYFVMELLQGEDLAQRLRGGGLMSWAEAGPILIQIAEALDAAHRVGVIHRDVKLANCFLLAGPPGQPPQVKVVDFGIAKVAVGDRAVTEQLTETGEIFGTVAYMPPEMGQGVTDDPRSDIYSLGVMMFRVLTGRLPYMGSAVEVIAQHLNKPVPSLRSVEPSVPPAVEQVVRRAMEKQPEDRPPTMWQLASQLRAAAGLPAVPRPSVKRPPVDPQLTRQAAEHAPTPAVPQGVASPRVPITDAEVIGLDQRPQPRRSRPKAVDPWREEHARTTAYGEEPEPPPMPGEPDLPPEMFAPAQDPSLRLDVDYGASAEPEPARRSGGLPKGLGRGLVVGGILVVIGVLVWTMLPADIETSLPDSLEEAAQEVGLDDDADEGEPVLLLIDTVPKDAKIYVDDQWRTERPIRVPRSDESVQIRVEADGYEPRKIRVKPQVTRRLEVKLDKIPRSKKRR